MGTDQAQGMIPSPCSPCPLSSKQGLGPRATAQPVAGGLSVPPSVLWKEEKKQDAPGSYNSGIFAVARAHSCASGLGTTCRASRELVA
jgi:hypothetical protein